MASPGRPWQWRAASGTIGPMSKMIWLGAFVGSMVGGYVPMLWGADMISMSGIVGSVVGGIAGIVGGYKLAQSFDM
jgi:hypothetical protein